VAAMRSAFPNNCDNVNSFYANGFWQSTNVSFAKAVEAASTNESA